MTFFYCSCTRQPIQHAVYYKYVYDLPTKNLPLEAVTEVDIWATRSMFRGLMEVNKDGLLVPDLASTINKISNKTYEITLNKNNNFTSGKIIDAHAVKESFLALKKSSKTNSGQQIKNISIESPYKFTIHLNTSNPNFIKDLSSHFFKVFNPQDLSDSSGLYQRVKDNLKLRKNNIKYPKEILLIKVPKKGLPDSFDKEIPFDTFLAQTSKSKDRDNRLSYRVQDTWGLVLNLKDKFKNLEDRLFLNESLNRYEIVNTAFKGHTPFHSLYSNKKTAPSGKNSNIKSFSLLLPTEVMNESKEICEYLNNLFEVDCKFISFLQLLKRIKSNDFDAALLSITLDSPYVESSLSLLDHNSTFSIVNIPLKYPDELNNLYGTQYMQVFEDFILKNMLFISISTPFREVYASNKEKYVPSLINPAFDSLENLLR